MRSLACTPPLVFEQLRNTKLQYSKIPSVAVALQIDIKMNTHKIAKMRRRSDVLRFAETIVKPQICN